jgi:PiT family inorganic phosphate transporter
MSISLTILLLTIVLALVFEFTNGFHDSANVVSTVIATKVLAPISAILLASLLNMLGATQISKVAETITSGFLPIQEHSQLIILSALVGAIFWNLFTWYFGIPSSSTYALIGGIIGAGIPSIGMGLIQWNNVLYKVLIPMIISPILGFFISMSFMKFVQMIEKKKQLQDGKFFGHLQILSSSFVALSHGFNDAQKTMAIIAMALFSAGKLSNIAIPFWVIAVCAIVMALGTATGGFKIIETVGTKITKLKTSQGFAAETTASLLIFSASLLGYPLSSTHLIVGSITGVGAAEDAKGVSKSTLKKMTLAWIFTMPGAGLVAGTTYMVLNLSL